jgi:hypothetical protein
MNRGSGSGPDGLNPEPNRRSLARFGSVRFHFQKVPVQSRFGT